MKQLVFKKQVSRDFAEVKRITDSVDQMLDHIPVEIDGSRIWNHGCRASLNKNHSGGYDLVLLSDSLPKRNKHMKVHVTVEEAEEDFHLPYKKLKVCMNSGAKNSNVLKVL